MRAVRQAFFILLLGLATVLAGVAPAAVSAAPAADLSALQAPSLKIQSPTNCPAGGCAAGQRLNMRLNFATIDPLLEDGNPNIKVCLYAPAGWDVQPAGVEYSASGVLSGKPYTPINDCAALSNYTPIAQLQTALTSVNLTDVIDFAFRLGTNAPGTQPENQFLARVYQHTTDPATWVTSNSASSDILKVIPFASPSYVANDGNTCGSNSPCYVNSADDFDKGIGTGLKDAVDSVPANGTIILLGPYTVKSKTVLVNRPVLLTGDVNAMLTYSGSASACQGALVSLNSQIRVTGLTINDGSCSTTSRNLLEINTNQDIAIESNNLTGGANAIYINDFGGNVTIRYNSIIGNAGYAVFWDPGAAPGDGAMDLVANNLHNNRSGSPVTCDSAGSTAHANRLANHNYWGGPAPSAADTYCAITPGKELGARILPRTNGPGVSAQLVSVKENNKVSVFNGQLSYDQSGAGEFPLYLVDHGYATQDSLPFWWKEMISPSPCGSFFDVFLPEGVMPTNATLKLYFKYNRTTACETVINSTQYCNQTTASKYPLFWYDPAGDVTDAWDTTGQAPAGTKAAGAAGQTTTCSISDREIQVSIDGTGRPDMLSDLGFTPFFVGVPVIKSFLPLALNQAINVTWQTNNEPDIKGFYVLHGDSPQSLVIFGDFITSKGTALTGAYYNSVTDPNLANNTLHYYQLQVVRTDGYIMYSNIVGIRPNIPTITPTFTITPTRTITPTPTKTRIIPSATPIPTLVPQQSPTRVPSQTRTPTQTPLGYIAQTGTGTPIPFLTRTPDLSATVTPEVTNTSLSSADGTSYPADIRTPDGTEIAMLETATPTPGEGTPSATASPETTITPAVSGTAAGGTSWWSLILGLLAGTAVVFGGGYLYMKSREQ